MTHNCRSKGKKGVSVSFTPEMKLTVTKDVFLSNPSNKQRFIEVVGQRLSARGCKVLHDQSDADVLIAKTAIESAASMDTILVGDDTDLLILLIHHAPLDKLSQKKV